VRNRRGRRRDARTGRGESEIAQRPAGAPRSRPPGDHSGRRDHARQHRLAIQDPTPAGNQPFVSADGRYTCVFNGEIYNHRELTERFRLPVRTACDGEVIPQLWAKLGASALAELRGMFAIALADGLADRLYLVRDPFGIKPLYWRLLPDGSLVFASEVRSLARLAPGPRVDDAAVARYLRYGAMAADQSPFLEITAVPPNSVAELGPDRRVEVRPIRPEAPPG
jgi:asparagine synthase (glutamine-hydrolysing)